MKSRSVERAREDAAQSEPECNICKKRGDGDWWYGSVTSPSGVSESAMVCEDCRKRLEEEGCSFFGVSFGWPQLLENIRALRKETAREPGSSSATDRSLRIPSTIV